MRLALIGYGNVGKAFHKLLERKRSQFPFRVAGIHTARHGTAYGSGLEFGAPAQSVEEFLETARPDIVLELTPLNPADGQPAIAHIEAAFARGMHVVTANKGPVAFAYRALADAARSVGVHFRFESTVMDGAPVFNLTRELLPGVEILGFAGALNSTSKIAIAAMRSGRSMAEGIAEAQQLGIAEADASFDIEGWDSAAKCSALANVLLGAAATPLDVDRKGIGRLTTEKVVELDRKGKAVVLISRGGKTKDGVKLRVRAEILDKTDPLATLDGTSNLLFLHTDLMGTLGMYSVRPTVEQTAYGVFSDIVDIARNV